MRPHLPPTELFVIEGIYAAIILTICLIIYFKTQEFYKLTKHKGIFFFRTTFLFLALAYLTRLLQTSFIIFSDKPFFIFKEFILINSFLVGYFSTTALGALTLTVISRQSTISKKEGLWLINIAALTLSLVVASLHIPQIGLFFQAALLITIIIFIIREKKKITVNKINYVLLILFWIINAFAALKVMHFSLPLKLVIYFCSVIIFIIILLRLIKRIPHEKKR